MTETRCQTSRQSPRQTPEHASRQTPDVTAREGTGPLHYTTLQYFNVMHITDDQRPLRSRTKPQGVSGLHPDAHVNVEHLHVQKCTEVKQKGVTRA